MTAASPALAPSVAVTERAKLKRVADDYYPTPDWVVALILQYLPRAASVLDPAAGTGEILRVVAARNPGCARLGIELDLERAKMALVLCGDALAMDWPDADLCVMNPPFLLARQFIERAIQWRAQDERRTVACLARLTILESEERRELHQQNPSDVYVLSRRPKFRGDTNGTDSVTACWLVWGPGRGGRWSVL